MNKFFVAKSREGDSLWARPAISNQGNDEWTASVMRFWWVRELVRLLVLGTLVCLILARADAFGVSWTSKRRLKHSHLSGSCASRMGFEGAGVSAFGGGGRESSLTSWVAPRRSVLGTRG